MDDASYLWLEELVWLYSGYTFIRREGYALEIMNNYVGTVARNVQDLLRQFPDIKAQNKNKLFQESDIDFYVKSNSTWKDFDQLNFKTRIEWKHEENFPIIYIFSTRKTAFWDSTFTLMYFYIDVYYL